MKAENALPKNLLQARLYRSKAINALRSNNPLMQRWRAYNKHVQNARNA